MLARTSMLPWELASCCRLQSQSLKTKVYAISIATPALTMHRVKRNRRQARWFLEHGADPNAFDGKPTPQTPPGMSLVAISVQAMKLYVAYGGDVQRGHLLHDANNSLESLIWLLDHNVSANKPQDMRANFYHHHGPSFVSTGVTPLMLAANRAGPRPVSCC